MSDGGVRLWSENRENEDGKQEERRLGKETDKCLEVGKESGQVFYKEKVDSMKATDHKLNKRLDFGSGRVGLSKVPSQAVWSPLLFLERDGSPLAVDQVEKALGRRNVSGQKGCSGITMLKGLDHQPKHCLVNEKDMKEGRAVIFNHSEGLGDKVNHNQGKDSEVGGALSDFFGHSKIKGKRLDGKKAVKKKAVKDVRSTMPFDRCSLSLDEDTDASCSSPSFYNSSDEGSLLKFKIFGGDKFGLLTQRGPRKSGPLKEQSDFSKEFDQIYGKRMEEQKDEVKEMLIAAANDPVEKVKLIDSLCRLGVSYHFQAEIEVQLNHIFDSQRNFGDDNYYDLYTVSLLFRVLRQHGYKMSCSNFNKFKNSDGKFNEILKNDVKGMLSLYEATNLRLHEEDILEEALAFSKAQLIKYLAENSCPRLAKQISNTLEYPLHKSMPRLEALKFISFYEQEESRNETLLLFAKLDFNRSRARLMLCKITMMLSVVDDTYDSYGTLEDLQLFTDAIHRWDISALDDLPNYMKVIYSTLLNLFDELSNDLTEKERSYRISYTKDMVRFARFQLHMIPLCSYFVEAQWSQQNYVPPFNEYYRNAFISMGSFGYTASSFLGIGEEIAEKILSRPKILSVAYKIGRLKNDLSSHKCLVNNFFFICMKVGEKRVHVVCSVECYMKEYGLSMEDITQKFNLIIENAWKDINQKCLKATPISMYILPLVVNFARLVEVTYKDGDGYTHPQHLKDTISTLFIDQIPIN
ncbi:hypothetical protein EZV62_009196 [Acer yangbiense]|uniref:Terpene synthase N-terminal domain-containing protein n=1 Tax=Acer yangbiense TaxID=1000413 RepID=A0A5C7IFL9_9ROSI|nr:hypothetical protein EZV62_009196 [Acer yangbiense]